MEDDSGINLKRFVPQKVSPWYFAKVILYVLVLSGLFYFIVSELDDDKQVKEDSIEEIRGIKVEF